MEELKRELNSHIGYVFDEKISELSRQHEQSVMQLSDRIKNLKSDLAAEQKVTNFWRMVTGFLGVALVVADLIILFANPNPSPQSIILCLGFLVAAAVLLLIAVKYEQVKAQILLRSPAG